MQQADVHRGADTEIRIQQRIGQQLLPPIHRVIIAADHRAAAHPILRLHLRAEILRINREADVRTDKSSCLSYTSIYENSRSELSERLFSLQSIIVCFS